MRKVSIRWNLSGLVKRETGVSPVRTRHRNLQALAVVPLGNREGKPQVSEQLVGRPAFRSTGTESSCHE